MASATIAFQKSKKTACLSAIALALGMSVAAHAQQSVSKPDFWPSKYKWHDYSQSAPQPVYNGKVKLMEKEGWVEAIDFNTLPLQHAIVRVRGNGERKIALFVDPTCPVSHSMELAINRLDNVTLYTFVVPTLNTDESRKRSERIACAGDNQQQAQAYENLMIADVAPKAVAPCKHTVDKVLASIRGLISPMDGTDFSRVSPTLVLGNGLIMDGGITKEDVEEHLQY